MKFCKDCKYFNGNDLCKSPDNGVDPVKGIALAKVASANRSILGNCKPNGILFEPIEPKPWWKFW